MQTSATAYNVIATAEEAAAHLLRIKEAEESFLGFIKLMRPDWILQDFHLLLIDILDRLEKGTLTHPETGAPVRRVLINMPPRHGKSQLTTVMFTVYYMARKPTREVISTSYGDQLVQTFGRTIKDIVSDNLVRQVFPDFQMSDQWTAVDYWKTTMGGVYVAASMHGSVVGKGANLLLWDDPFKSRAEAESPTQRNRVWDSYVGSLHTRKQPELDGTPPIEIGILTRWHPDDIAGRIMETEEFKNGEWMVVSFPAIIDIDTPNERALWEARVPLAELKKMRRLNAREFEAQYQQRPFIEGGNLIKTSWFRTYDKADLPPLASLIIAADTAFKAKEENDWSVLLVAGMGQDGNIYILDVIRRKAEFPELKRLSTQTAALYRPKGLRGFYIEDKASGQSLIQELRNQSGIPVIPYKLVNDKVARTNAVSPLIEGGIVFVPRPDQAPWLEAFLKECEQFPAGAHDDQVDALTLALDVLSKINIGATQAINAPVHEMFVHHALMHVAGDMNKPIWPITYDGKLSEDFERMAASWGEPNFMSRA